MTDTEREIRRVVEYLIWEANLARYEDCKRIEREAVERLLALIKPPPVADSDLPVRDAAGTARNPGDPRSGGGWR